VKKKGYWGCCWGARLAKLGGCFWRTEKKLELWLKGSSMLRKLQGQQKDPHGGGTSEKRKD